MKPKRPAGPRLGELLETRGRLKRDVLIEALRHQRASGGRIGTCLLELEKITEDDLLHVLSDQLKVPFTPPEELRSLPEEIVKLIPEKVARQRFSIPLRSSSTYLTVAMRDPTDLLALDELAFVTGKRVRPQVASEMRILEALAKYYGVELAGRFVKLLDRLNRERFFWGRDASAEAPAGGIGDLPPLLAPPAAPDLRGPSGEQFLVAAPGAPSAAGHPSGEILAPIVTVFPPAAVPAASGSKAPAATVESAARAAHPVSLSPVAPPPPRTATGSATSTPAPAQPTPPIATPPPAMPAAPPPTVAAPVVPPPPIAPPPIAAPLPPNAPVVAPPAIVSPSPPVAPVVAPPAPPFAAPEALPAPAPAASAAAISGPLPIDAAEARLRDPSGRDEIGQLLLEFARGRVASALLLMVRRDEAAGWLGFGPGLDDESVESCKVELNAPSFVRALRDGASLHRGALAELPAHAEIRAMLGTNWATDILALPLRVRERLVGVLVVTLEEGVFSPEQLDEMTRLVGKASMALELLVLKQKLHG